MWQPDVNIYMILAAYITGFPFDLIQALATVIFLWLAARQMLEKMDRIRIKYNVCVH
jgi:energy-coupling factor transport system ATP-binding protein